MRSDFADEHPECEVIGTDLSPIPPEWVPPNLRFEIDDCTKDWTFSHNSFDFIHIRFLVGGIADWTHLFRQAYHCCKPGGWVQSGEFEAIILSDDGTVNDQTTMGTLWNKLLIEAGKKAGRSFLIKTENLQRKGLEEAGFVDIQEVTYKSPINGWPKDPHLAEIGRYIELTMDNDIEGYTMYLWNQVMGWPMDEYQVFLMLMRKEIRSKIIHSYFYVRYVYGRKPETA
ncbi:hypothetical protein TOPH_03891 [Tolypocladium ophioglossoides CBS 100239]|uniref:Uncharacterized protein n=1 Tax=Tolypocladium ophioglossoides (strain CBS 100239) TaxID=1163406 RepID=A0A0L0NDD3_TOLOC|nr:hypothetical protein TOPH_03891 [Tolypocladium ophioglossoides CBS 100239]